MFRSSKLIIKYKNFIFSKFSLSLILAISLISFILGLILPVFQKETLFSLFKSEVSLLSGVIDLYESGDVFLGSVILLFTIIFPIAKYLVVFYLLINAKSNRAVRLFDKVKSLGKWSMLDVFVIAVLLSYFKLGEGIFLKLTLREGTIFFAVSVVTSIVVTILIPKRMK